VASLYRPSSGLFYDLVHVGLHLEDRKIFESSNDLSTFVGQASTGKAGVSAMYYNRLDIKAYKSYFFVNDLMVALGAGMETGNDNHIVTTLNQRYFKNNDGFVSGKTSAGEQWIWQDSTAYFSLNKDQEIKTRIDHRTGNWGNIDNASGNSPVTDSLITLFINHHQNPQYAYLIKPGVGLSETKNESEISRVKVLTNTVETQGIAVDGTCMIVFYKPGTITVSEKTTISVDQPCIVIYNSQDHRQLYVSDPTKKLKVIHISVNKQLLSVKLQTGDLAGFTMEVIL